MLRKQFLWDAVGKNTVFSACRKESNEKQIFCFFPPFTSSIEPYVCVGGGGRGEQPSVRGICTTLWGTCPCQVPPPQKSVRAFYPKQNQKQAKNCSWQNRSQNLGHFTECREPFVLVLVNIEVFREAQFKVYAVSIQYFPFCCKHNKGFPFEQAERRLLRRVENEGG